MIFSTSVRLAGTKFSLPVKRRASINSRTLRKTDRCCVFLEKCGLPKFWKFRKRGKAERFQLFSSRSVSRPFPNFITGRYYPRCGPLPSNDNLCVTNAFLASFNQSLRTARWVAERLTHMLVGTQRRTARRRFLLDPTFRSCLSRFYRISFRRWCENHDLSRGHLAAARNHVLSANAHKSTFLYPTNIVAQHKIANNGIWNTLEKAVRLLTTNYSTIYVVTGTLLLPDRLTEIAALNLRLFSEQNPLSPLPSYPQLDDLLRVSFSTLGPGGPAVPTHMFKVIACSHPYGIPNHFPAFPFLRAFVIPNAPVTDRLWRFRVPVKFIEKYTTLNFVALKSYLTQQLNVALDTQPQLLQSYSPKIIRSVLSDTSLRHIYMPLTESDFKENVSNWTRSWNVIAALSKDYPRLKDVYDWPFLDWLLMPTPTLQPLLDAPQIPFPLSQTFPHNTRSPHAFAQFFNWRQRRANCKNPTVSNTFSKTESVASKPIIDMTTKTEPVLSNFANTERPELRRGNALVAPHISFSPSCAQRLVSYIVSFQQIRKWKRHSFPILSRLLKKT